MVLVNSRRNVLKSFAYTTLGLTTLVSQNSLAEKLKPGTAKDWVIFDGLSSFYDMNPPKQGKEREKSKNSLKASDRVKNDVLNSRVTVIRTTTGAVYPVFPGESAFEKAVSMVSYAHRWIEHNSDFVTLAKSTDDIFKAKKSKKVAILLCFQNSHVLGKNVERVDMFRGLGVLTMQLTYNGRNQLGAGANMGENLPLTEFGHEAVDKMNASKVLIDLSHSNRQTCLDAIKASQSPVTISHSGCRALADFPRNKTDEEMRLLVEKGGVFGLYFMPFLAKNSKATSEHLIAHIEHAINVCGEDHIAIGTDGSPVGIDDLELVREQNDIFTQKRLDQGVAAAGEKIGNVNLLPDLSGPRQYIDLALKLSDRGHSANRIEKIMGKNALRIMKDVCDS